MKLCSGYNRSKEPNQAGKNLPELINIIVWVRQLIARVADTIATATSLLGDLQGYQDFKSECTSVNQEMTSFMKEQVRVLSFMKEQTKVLSFLMEHIYR